MGAKGGEISKDKENIWQFVADRIQSLLFNRKIELPELTNNNELSTKN
jgi:hypothetical protein